ncbi:MAG: hypothetical protein V4494_05165 [Chlamydiota bacterium]
MTVPASPDAPKPPAAAPEHLSVQHPFSTASSGGFAAMLGPTATPEQVQKAMLQAINAIITDMKREAKKAHEASEQLKKVIEGKDD